MEDKGCIWDTLFFISTISLPRCNPCYFPVTYLAITHAASDMST